MEYVKEKIPAILGIFIFLILCVIAYYFAFVESKPYYSQIDNTKYERLNAKEYEYTLTSYDAKGKSKELSFKTNRELKENAFIEFEVMITRGVISWREVFEEDLPEKVRSKYGET